MEERHRRRSRRGQQRPLSADRWLRAPSLARQRSVRHHRRRHEDDGNAYPRGRPDCQLQLQGADGHRRHLPSRTSWRPATCSSRSRRRAPLSITNIWAIACRTTTTSTAAALPLRPTYFTLSGTSMATRRRQRSRRRSVAEESEPDAGPGQSPLDEDGLEVLPGI